MEGEYVGDGEVVLKSYSVLFIDIVGIPVDGRYDGFTEGADR
jgi:hypothetical protein